MRYEERTIDEVQSLNDIVEVISSTVPLKRSGKTFRACCPFHQEKTPSFYVHPEKQIFHCFGCGVGGNVFSFLMKYENLTFPEALRDLARRVNVVLPERTPQSPKEATETEALYEIYRLAHTYYAENLNHPERGKAARAYLEKRGIPEALWREVGLGWASAEWRGLFEFLVRRGMKQDLLFRSGLILRAQGGNPYDLFRGRVLFPIRNLQGKVIALGGRGLGEETPKYLNSPESPLFRKRRELFGLHQAKRSLGSREVPVLMVEGYFDYLRMCSNGFPNVVATLGTAVTEDHVRILKRYAPEAIVIYDGDQAGEAAALRGLEVFLEGEMNAKIVVLPPGEDPDTLIQKEGQAAFKKRVDSAEDFFDFKWKFLSRRFSPQDPTGMLCLSQEFLETLSKVRNPLLLDLYLKKLARLLGVEEPSLRKKLAETKTRARPQENGPTPSVASLSFPPPYPEEGMLISLLLGDASLWAQGAESLEPEDFRHPELREAFRMLKEAYGQGAPLSSTHFLNRWEGELVKSLLAAHSMRTLGLQESRKAWSDCLMKIRERRVRERLEGLRRAIQEAEGGGRESEVHYLLKEYRSLLVQKG